MNTGPINKRYANAIFEFAKQNGDGEVLLDEFRLLMSQFNNFPMLSSVLENPTIGKDKKIDVLKKSVGGFGSITYNKAVEMVVDNGRAEFMQSIAMMYEDVYRKNKNIVSSEIISATPIDSSTEQALIRLIAKQSNKIVEFKRTLDKDIIGGFILEVEDMRFDASVRTQLNEIKKKIIK